MSTTDTRAAFEASVKKKFPLANLSRNTEVGNYRSCVIEDMWWAYQAATEAAKATGTAGELLGSLHEDIMNIPVSLDLRIPSDASQMLAYKMGHRDARHAAAELAANAEAARQPAPVVAVKGWKQRAKEAMPQYADCEYFSPEVKHVYMAKEIADLRAALAATNRSQP